MEKPEMFPVEFKNEEQKYIFRYLKKEHDIDFETLLITQQQYLNIVREVRTSFFPHVQINIKIEPFEKGSFEFVQLIQEYAPVVAVATPYISNIESILKIINSYFSLKVLLNGKKPEKVEPIEINGDKSVKITGNGNTVIMDNRVYKFYTKSHSADKSFNKILEKLKDHDEIDGFTVMREDDVTPTIEAKREQYKDLDLTNSVLDADSKEETEEAVLYIRRFDVQPKINCKWPFLYKTRKQSFIIRDGNFIAKVNDGIRFGKGDRIKAEVKITSVYDPEYNMYRPNKFEIIKVTDIIFRNDDSDGKQISLLDNLKK